MGEEVNNYILINKNEFILHFVVDNKTGDFDFYADFGSNNLFAELDESDEFFDEIKEFLLSSFEKRKKNYVDAPSEEFAGNSMKLIELEGRTEITRYLEFKLVNDKIIVSFSPNCKINEFDFLPKIHLPGIMRGGASAWLFPMCNLRDNLKSKFETKILKKGEKNYE
jgi:hypothetical protein